MAKPLPSPELLREILDYNFSTGLFRWKSRGAHLFKNGRGQSADHNCKAWNGRFAGAPALTATDGKGYLRGNIFAVAVAAHRVAWAHYYLEWPVGEIDHINGIGSDNRIINLRVVNSTTNKRNMGLRHDNRSGVPGVKLTRNGTWRAEIGIGGRNRWLGAFATFDEALAARRAAEKALGYTARYSTVDPCPPPE